jgi:sorbitol-specific phosphotransferase system component IIA
MLIGSFIGIIVSKTISSNMRVQMSSDKVILYFAKHNYIVPFIIGKDVLKNIERLGHSLNKFTNSAAFNSTPRGTVLTDKKPIMMRFLNIL